MYMTMYTATINSISPPDVVTGANFLSGYSLLLLLLKLPIVQPHLGKFLSCMCEYL